MSKKVAVVSSLEGLLIPDLWPIAASRLHVAEFQLTTRETAGFEELMGVRLDAMRRRHISPGMLRQALAGVEPFEGAAEFVSTVQGAPGVEYTVISNTIEDLSGGLIAALGIQHFHANRFITEGDRFSLQLRAGVRKGELAAGAAARADILVAVGHTPGDIPLLKRADVQFLLNPAGEVRSAFPAARVCRNLPELGRCFARLISVLHEERRVVVAEPLSRSAVESLSRLFNVEVLKDRARDVLEKAVEGADALIVRSGVKADAGLIQKGGRLKVIGRAGVGVDNIDVEAATRAGILVVNAPEGNTNAAAEHTFGLILSAARNIPQAHSSLKAGRWEKAKYEGAELRGKTLAVVGLGRIGSTVARFASAFGMAVVAFDPYLPAERFEAAGVRRAATLDEALSGADFVTLHTPMTGRLIGERELALMKEGAVLVNTARGGLVDETALAEALRSGRLRAAACDVFVTEPVEPSSPLLAHENFIATPHLGASTREAKESVGAIIASKVKQALLFERAAGAVNFAVPGAEDIEDSGPLLEFAEWAGSLYGQYRQAVSGSSGEGKVVDAVYGGEAARAGSDIMDRALLKGMLCPALRRWVNLISAPALAREGGWGVRSRKAELAEGFENMITVRGGSLSLAGTMVARGEYRLLEIGEFSVDIPAYPCILLATVRTGDGWSERVRSVLADAGSAPRAVRTVNSAASKAVVAGLDAIVPDAMERVAGLDGVLSTVLLRNTIRGGGEPWT